MDDLIDFPCSDLWQDYYHERGLTPRRSAQSDLARSQREDELVRVVSEIARLTRLLLDARAEVVEQRPARASHPAPRSGRPTASGPEQPATMPSGSTSSPKKREMTAQEETTRKPGQPRFSGGVQV